MLRETLGRPSLAVIGRYGTDARSLPFAAADCFGVVRRLTSSRDTPAFGARRRRPPAGGVCLTARESGRWHSPCASRGTTVGATEPSREGQSQRGAHRPEYRRRETCLRGRNERSPAAESDGLQPWEDVNHLEILTALKNSGNTKIHDHICQ